jgi:hypothetical protein
VGIPFRSFLGRFKRRDEVSNRRRADALPAKRTSLWAQQLLQIPILPDWSPIASQWAGPVGMWPVAKLMGRACWQLLVREFFF